MTIEEGLRSQVDELAKQVSQIRDNELKHIDARLGALEGRVRAPLATLYLLAAFAVFVGIVGFTSLPASIGWPVAGACGAILVLALVGIKRLAAIKRE